MGGVVSQVGGVVSHVGGVVSHVGGVVSQVGVVGSLVVGYYCEQCEVSSKGSRCSKCDGQCEYASHDKFSMHWSHPCTLVGGSDWFCVNRDTCVLVSINQTRLKCTPRQGLHKVNVALENGHIYIYLHSLYTSQATSGTPHCTRMA